MTSLITREFYDTTYGGDAVPVSVFKRISQKATVKVDELTRGKAATAIGEQTIGSVKMATCAIADLIWKGEAGGGRLQTSESTAGDYSASFEQTTLDEAIRKEAGHWLHGTGLLFRGV